MKKKTIEIEINVPEPGDTLPFVVWSGPDGHKVEVTEDGYILGTSSNDEDATYEVLRMLLGVNDVKPKLVIA